MPIIIGRYWKPIRLKHSKKSFNQHTEDTMKTYQCIVCGFIYEESKGLPEEGIAAGTRWDDIPADWECPDCGVAKADFDMIEI